MSLVGRLRGPLLTVGAVLGVLCLASLGAMLAFGVRPLIVQSGSMSPGIPTGSVVLAQERPAAEAAIGDVVSVPTPGGARVMHRVVATEPLEDRTVLTLKGDANDAADPDPYVVEHVHEVFLDAPGLGYAVDWLAGPFGRFAGGALVGVLLLVAFSSPTPVGPPAKHFAPKPAPVRRHRTATMTATGVLVLLAIAGRDVASARPAHAAFVDSATLTSGSLAAYTVPAPVVGSCAVTGNALSGFTARITWPGVTSPRTLGYTATIVESGASLTVTTVGANRRVDVTSGLLGSLLGSDVTVRIRSVVTTSPSWTSAATDQKLRVGLLGLSLTCL